MKLNLKQKQKNPLRFDLFIVIPFTQLFLDNKLTGVSAFFSLAWTLLD